MFSDQNGIRIEVNSRKTTEKSSNTWKLNNIFPNNPWVKKKSHGSFKKCTQ